MREYLPFLVNAGMLICGGVCDARRREIPDTVPLALFLTGLLCGDRLGPRFLLLILTAAVFLLADRLTAGEAPGGDFKLMCSLAFTAGLHVFLATLLLAAMGAWGLGRIRGQRGSRHVPWCAYVAPAYVCAFALAALLH
jgi:Flp pilus assembly protein protease CpaA